MCCKGFWKRIIPFALALVFGISMASFYQKGFSVKNQENVKSKNKIINSTEGNGIGSSGDSKPNWEFGANYKAESSESSSNSSVSKLKITSKIQSNYTDEARLNNAQGTISLRVTFLASGQIGNISVVSGLPYGLTEQAIAAAKQIRFEPAKKNGVPYTVIKTVQYTFTIY